MTDELRAKVEHRKRRIETNRRLLEAGEVLDDRVPTVYNMQGKHARRLGDLAVRLGEPDQAREWFGESVDYYLEKVRYEREEADRSPGADEAVQLVDLLYSGLLSEDRERLDRVRAAVRGMPRTFPEDHPENAYLYHYALGLAACLDDGDDLRPRIAYLRDAREHTESRFEGFVGAILDVLSGLADRDPDRFRAGVASVVADLEAAEDDELYPRIAGSALVALGRRAGLDVEVDSEHVYAHL